LLSLDDLAVTRRALEGFEALGRPPLGGAMPTAAAGGGKRGGRAQ
jgi:hypothetical protein